MTIRADQYPVGVTIKQIIDACGGWTAAGKAVHRRAATLFKWKIIPTQHVDVIVRLSGIPLEKIRPDLAAARAPLPKAA